MKKHLQGVLLTLVLTGSAVIMVFLVGHLIAMISIDHPYIAIGTGIAFLCLYPAGLLASSLLDLREEKQRKREWDAYARANTRKENLARRSHGDKA